MTIHIVQPLIPHYRVSLFKGLQKLMPCIFYSGFSSEVGMSESLDSLNDNCTIRLYPLGLKWQKNLLSISFSKGDVLVVCGDIRFISNYPLMLKAKLRGVKVVWWGQVWSAGTSKVSFWIRIFISRIFANRFLAYTSRELTKIPFFLFSKKQLFATENAIDDNAVQKAKAIFTNEKLIAFRAEKGLINKKIILFCGRITEKVDMKFALDVMQKLFTQSDLYVFAIIGSGDQMYDLQEYGRTLGCDQRIFWIGAVFGEENLAPWFLSSSVFFYPGSIGLSITHAFHYALPIVTHGDISKHMPEIAALEIGGNGNVYDIGDVDGAVSALSGILENDELQKQYGKHALHTARAKYSMDAMVNNFYKAVTF